MLVTHTSSCSWIILLSPQEQSERLLVMYPLTLIILSEQSDGLFYKVPPSTLCFWPCSVCIWSIVCVCKRRCIQMTFWLQGKLPLNMITVTTPCQDVKPNSFMIEGTLTESVACSSTRCHLSRHVKRDFNEHAFPCMLYAKWPFSWIC